MFQFSSFSKFDVSIGGVDRTVRESGEVTRSALYAIIHEQYDDLNIFNDVALLFVSSRVVFSKSFLQQA